MSSSRPKSQRVFRWDAASRGGGTSLRVLIRPPSPSLTNRCEWVGGSSTSLAGTNVRVYGPTPIRSPGPSQREATATPFTIVPFRLCRSRTNHRPEGSRLSSAWCRETMALSSFTCTPCARPIRATGAETAISVAQLAPSVMRKRASAAPVGGASTTVSDNADGGAAASGAAGLAVGESKGRGPAGGPAWGAPPGVTPPGRVATVRLTAADICLPCPVPAAAERATASRGRRPSGPHAKAPLSPPATKHHGQPGRPFCPRLTRLSRSRGSIAVGLSRRHAPNHHSLLRRVPRVPRTRDGS